MALPLMPKATAVWLVDNTALTFDQIADFCGLHPLEVQGVADGEVAVGIVGLDPVTTGQLTADDIKAAESDPKRKLVIAETTVPKPATRAKGPRYTPVAKRQDRPNAIAWLIRYHPELTDGQVSKLVGTTKPTINSIRDRSHWNINNIKLEDPVSLGMCSQLELDTAVTKAQQRVRAREAREAKDSRKNQHETGAASGATVAASPASDAGAESTAQPTRQRSPTNQPREELWAGAANVAEPVAAPETAEAVLPEGPEAPPARNDARERERVFGSPSVRKEPAEGEAGDSSDSGAA